jgi:8-oxo-dGTP pyrophosphatase MutT (NUDIX family)
VRTGCRVLVRYALAVIANEGTPGLLKSGTVGSGPPAGAGTELAAELSRYTPRSDVEAHDVARVQALAAGPDPWSRSTPVHATGSAVVVHPDTGRVLLRWHERMNGWLLVGGHADPGEIRPIDISMREAHEETGLDDLQPWPDPHAPTLVHVAVVPVPAGKGEPAHEHADLRYVLATARPERATAESDTAALRWLPVGDAIDAVSEDNLRVSLRRVSRLLFQSSRSGSVRTIRS